MARNIVMIIAPNSYRDEELTEPKTMLEKAGFDVAIASKGVKTATGKLGGSTQVDLDISEMDVTNYDSIIFVGGPGSNVYFDDPVAHSIVKKAHDQNKIIAAICIAPSILANAGVLQGKKATSFPTQEKNLVSKGALYTNEDVTVDGNIITANGPDAAAKFGETIIKILNNGAKSG
ncbi:MAG: DJ-1/PfpI family protein [Nanoarchaeota archaeon]